MHVFLVYNIYIICALGTRLYDVKNSVLCRGLHEVSNQRKASQ